MTFQSRDLRGVRSPGSAPAPFELGNVQKRRGSDHGRIVGGQEAEPHAYPFMAALFIDVEYFCGGSILSESHATFHSSHLDLRQLYSSDENYILTAAHCMDGFNTIEVVLGAHNITAEEPEQVKKAFDNTLLYYHPHIGWPNGYFSLDRCSGRPTILRE